MIDSHCHINLEHFEDDLEGTVSRALGEGVRALMNIGYDPDTARETIALVERFPFVFGVVGIHPHDAQRLDDGYEDVIRGLLDHDRILGIGEVGLDYYRDLSPREVQVEAFRRMIHLSREKSAPLVIHCRNAFDDVMQILEDEGPPYRGIFHAFGGSAEQALRALELGFHVGIGGVVTYRNSGVDDALAEIPIDRIVLETDSPYLTPHPWRGNRNEPAYVERVLYRIAEIKQLDPIELSLATDENFCRAMGIAPSMLPDGVYQVDDVVFVHRPADADRVGAFLERAGEGAEEVVLCGLEDPLADFAWSTALCGAARARGLRVRVDTNGLGSQHAGRDICGELGEMADEVVVRFYGASAAHHDRFSPVPVGEEGFEIACDFVRCAGKTSMDTVCEFIATPKFSPDACRVLAKSLGAQYDIRMYRS